jgi:hypothetical protein
VFDGSADVARRAVAVAGSLPRGGLAKVAWCPFSSWGTEPEGWQRAGGVAGVVAAAGMLVCPERRKILVARFGKVAMTCGPRLVRIWEAPSPGLPPEVAVLASQDLMAASNSKPLSSRRIIDGTCV